jgi:GntR family transcriptional regulator
MDIAIDASAPEPVYEQIVRQIHGGVTSGALRPGTPLPSVRQLAGDLVLNRNTVARAYKILEEQGVILTAGRKGTFVRQGAVQEVTKLRTGHARRAIGRLIEALAAEGLSRDEIADAFNGALALQTGKG